MTKEATTTLGFLGDIMLARGVQAHYLARPDDFAMDDIRACLSDCDHVHANLETPISSVGAPDPTQAPNVCFCAAPETVGILRHLGISSVTLANNHVLDYGPDALTQTKSVLDDAMIARCGAGADRTEANTPLFCQAGAYKIGIIPSNFIYSASTRHATEYSAGAADHKIERLEASIKEVRDQVDIVIVSVHWGLEYSFYPLPYIQRAARRMVDAGAHLVIGHGPHYVQPIEKYRNGTIVYSLGNFIFDEPFPFANISYILKVELHANRVKRASVHPVLLKNHVPHLVQNDQTRRLKRFIEDGARGFTSKSTRFWQDLSNTYLQVMISRVIKTRTIKYLTANPPGFYQDVGLKNYLAKFRLLRQNG